MLPCWLWARFRFFQCDIGPSHSGVSGGAFQAEGVWSVSVESAMECRMRGKDVFCVVSFGGTMRSAMSVLLEKTAFGGNASLQLADPGSAHILEHPTTACPRRATLAASKVPAILRDLAGRELLVSHALGSHLFADEEFLCGTNHSRCENPCEHLRVEANEVVVH